MQAAVKLIVGHLELVPDLGPGAPRDLAPDALAVRPDANRGRADEAVLRGVDVDRVLTVTTTARCVVRHARSVTLFLAPRLAPRLGSRSPKGPLSWWSGAGSNCRPSAFQADAHTN